MSVVSIFCVISVAIVESFSREVVIRTVGIVFVFPGEIFVRVHGGLSLMGVVMLRGMFMRGDLLG